jgi:hypothetical protein
VVTVLHPKSRIQCINHLTLSRQQEYETTYEKNGWFLSRKRPKHIKAKFFFIKDRIDSGEMGVEYQTTEEMWADVFTKPLQGTTLRQMHAKLMNCKVNYEEDKVEFEQSIAKANDTRKAIPVTGRVTRQGPTQTMQECVGGSQYNRKK